MHEHRRLDRDSNKLEKEECERKKEGRPNRTFLHLRLNLLILIGLILISQFLNIYFSLAFYFILFYFYLFIFLLLFLALWLFDLVDLLIRVYYLSTRQFVNCVFFKTLPLCPTLCAVCVLQQHGAGLAQGQFSYIPFRLKPFFFLHNERYVQTNA